MVILGFLYNKGNSLNLPLLISRYGRIPLAAYKIYLNSFTSDYGLLSMEDVCVIPPALVFCGQ